ncbi:MAG: sensor histidine kinase [Candidatus Curtissbacteria bacterium]|nr:sensor histidine kinase [Candidatus Curtissbacteria bacterium]
MIKLNLRLLLIFLEIAIIPVALISYLALFNTKSAITTQVLNQLDQLAAITKNRVRSANVQNLELLSDVINSASGGRPISEFKSLIDPESDIRSISITDVGGKVTSSTDPEKVGRNFGSEEFFLKARVSRRATTFLQGKNRELLIVVSGPITRDGELIGVAIVEKNGASFLSIFNENVGLGTSGEILLVARDRNGGSVYITPSKFDQLGPLSRSTPKDDFSQAATQALLGREQTFDSSIDYRQEKVLASTRYIEEADLGVIAKIDQKEAYLSIAKLSGLLTIVSLVSVSVIALISLSAATSIVAPIKKLINMTNKISGGDFSHRAVVESRDEIGQLELSFNIMAMKLKRSYEGLEQKVRERTKELEVSTRNLEIANANLKNLDKLKDEFVSIASHELRTPMTAIKGMVSMIVDGDYGKVEKGLHEPLADIANSTDRLIVLVNELLNVSRIEAGRLKFELSDFAIQPVIGEVVTSLIPLAKGKNLYLDFKYDGLTFVQGDTNKIREVLSNLIGNSLKFTERGGITISLEEDGDLLKVFVQDTGIGISSEDQVKLFGKFKQISSYQVGRPAGSGLGLYISRELTRKMGGDLWIQKSEPQQGSTFVFSLPLATSELAKRLREVVKQQSQEVQL